MHRTLWGSFVWVSSLCKHDTYKYLSVYLVFGLDLLSWHLFASYTWVPSFLLVLLLKNGCQKGSEDGRSNSIEDSHNKSKFWNVSEICEPSQCQFLQLPVHPKINKVWHLYANAVMLYWIIANSYMYYH